MPCRLERFKASSRKSYFVLAYDKLYLYIIFHFFLQIPTVCWKSVASILQSMVVFEFGSLVLFHCKHHLVPFSLLILHKSYGIEIIENIFKNLCILRIIGTSQQSLFISKRYQKYQLKRGNCMYELMNTYTFVFFVSLCMDSL